MIIVTDMVEVRCEGLSAQAVFCEICTRTLTVIFFSVARVTKRYKPKVASVFFTASDTKPPQEYRKTVIKLP